MKPTSVGSCGLAHNPQDQEKDPRIIKWEQQTKPPLCLFSSVEDLSNPLHVERVTAENLRPVINQMVAEDAHLMTDTSTVLKSAGSERTHSKVNHKRKEYVRLENGVCITTNGVEGFFANLKRGINGVYHHVGKHHLHRYLAEFDFRYNLRKTTDGERALTALKKTEGKRLMLRGSVAKRSPE